MGISYGHIISIPHYLHLCRSRFLGWMRDLTAEGIESNPGPSWDDLLSKLQELYPKDYPRAQDYLNSLEEHLKKAFESPFVTTVEVGRFFEDQKMQAEHKVPPAVASMIKEGLSKLETSFPSIGIVSYHIIQECILLSSIVSFSFFFHFLSVYASSSTDR